MVLWNTAAEKIFGYSKEEALGTMLHKLIMLPTAIPRFREGFRRFLKNGTGPLLNRPIETTAVRKDGKEIVVELHITPFQLNGKWHALGLVLDVTQMRKKEEEERERVMFFRRLVEGAAEGIITIQDGVIKYANPATETISGYKLEEIIGKPFVDFVHPDEREKLLERYRRRMAGEDVENQYETILIGKDGREIRAELRVSLIMFEGRLAELVLINDITEKKRILEELKESERRYRELFENSMDIIAVGELDGTLVDVNRAIEAYGTKKNEVLGKNILELFPAEYHPLLRSDLRKLSHGIPVRGEIPIETPQGKRVMEYRGRPLKRAGGVIGFQTALRDITRRKKYHEELRRHRDRLEETVRERTRELEEERQKVLAILESIREGILVLDEGGGIVMINPSAEEMIGMAEKKAIGRSVEKVCPYLEGINLKLLKELEASGDTVEREVERSDGTRRVVEISSYPLVGEGEVVRGHIVVIRDITERKIIEKERLERQKLEALGHLSAGLAHDFNNILTAVLGYITALSAKLGEEGEAAELLKRAQEEIYRARGITEQLLTFTEGSGEPLKMETDIKEVVEKSTGLFLSGSSCKVKLNVDEDLWGVWGDSAQLTQLLGNILLNAKEACGEEGVIEISASNVKIKKHPSLPKGRYVKISVKDNGEGIPEEIQDRIFDPFFSTKEEGRGLGLYSAYLIATRHGGDIDFESHPGRGTTFHILLPSTGKAPRREIKEKAGEATVGEGKIRVLLMDDQEAVLDSTSLLLKELGFEVETARNGQEAIERYKRALEEGKAFHAVVMDLTVPGGMGGKEAIKRLKEIDPNVRAIVYTGYSNDPILSSFREYGFSGALKKPFKIEELITEIKRVAGESMG